MSDARSAGDARSACVRYRENLPPHVISVLHAERSRRVIQPDDVAAGVRLVVIVRSGVARARLVPDSEDISVRVVTVVKDGISPDFLHQKDILYK